MIFEGTIKNGLPVIVEAYIIPEEKGDDTCPSSPLEIEIIKVSFESGHEFQEEYDEADLEQQALDLIREGEY